METTLGQLFVLGFKCHLVESLNQSQTFIQFSASADYSKFMKYLLQKLSVTNNIWKIYVLQQLFCVRAGNGSVSQLVTVYPALPRQPAGDLFYGQGLRRGKC